MAKDNLLNAIIDVFHRIYPHSLASEHGRSCHKLFYIPILWHGCSGSTYSTFKEVLLLQKLLQVNTSKLTEYSLHVDQAAD